MKTQSLIMSQPTRFNFNRVKRHPANPIIQRHKDKKRQQILRYNMAANK